MAETAETKQEFRPSSLLDTDLYKYTMQQAVLHHFPTVQAAYRFTHRDSDVLFTKRCVDVFRRSVSQFGEMSLSHDEREWLEKNCPYLRKDYLDYLATFRFNPDQVSIRFEPVSEDGERGHIEIDAVGLWVETILWEVPLMAVLSELYFTLVDTDWNYDGQSQSAYDKASTILEAGCAFSEFGTRRRRSLKTQDLVMDAILKASRDHPGKGKVNGTSNMFFAKKYGVQPVGTIAHEWFMAVGALRGYELANSTALALWEEIYPDALLIALTDTFSTQAFFHDLLARPGALQRWTGLRQDSGDPYAFAPRAKEAYAQAGVDHTAKTIVYSDALDVDKALGLKRQCDELGFKCAFGIGTSLSNDFRRASSGGREKSRALNMVIKLAAVGGRPTVKISDELTKNTGDADTVRRVKKLFGLLVEE